MFDISLRLSDMSIGLRMEGKLYHLLLNLFIPILTNIGFPF
jgi:hypothetical protein